MEHGHWKRFVEIREGLKKDGVDGGEAWGHAAAALEKELEEGREEDQVGSVVVGATEGSDHASAGYFGSGV